MDQHSIEKRRAQISVSGTLGSGKSTVAASLADVLHWRYVSTGAAQRKIAQALNISTLDLNRIAENDRVIDQSIDAVFRDLRTVDGIVVDSRMAWYFLPGSFRVRLVVTSPIAVQRIIEDKKRNAEKYSDAGIAVAEIMARAESEKLRFENTYDVDITAKENFDLTIDTSNISAADAVELILTSYHRWASEVPVPLENKL